MSNLYKIFIVMVFSSLFYGCARDFKRFEYSPDGEFVLCISTETEIPAVRYNVNGTVKRTSDNKIVSKKVFLGTADIPEDIMSKQRFSVQAWYKDKVIVLYKNKFTEEIFFSEEF